MVNVRVERRGIRSRRVWISEMSAKRTADEASKDNLDDTKARVSLLSWEKHGRYLLTGHAGSTICGGRVAPIKAG